MNEAKKNLTLSEILSELNQYCVKKMSGTLFMTTQDNRSAGFVFQEGKVVSCAYGHERGLAALEKIKQIEIASCAFSDKLIFSLVDNSAALPNTPAIFDYLGYRYQETLETPNVTANETESTKKTYRGILINESKEKEEKNPSAHKSRRIYRGQILDD
jgi:hypothetical protein